MDRDFTESDAKLIDETDFRDFVLKEFKDVSLEATVEELAEFAFGSVESAIEAYLMKDNK